MLGLLLVASVSFGANCFTDCMDLKSPNTMGRQQTSFTKYNPYTYMEMLSTKLAGFGLECLAMCMDHVPMTVEFEKVDGEVQMKERRSVEETSEDVPEVEETSEAGPKEGPGPKHGPKAGPKHGPKQGPGPKEGPGPEVEDELEAVLEELETKLMSRSARKKRNMCEKAEKYGDNEHLTCIVCLEVTDADGIPACAYDAKGCVMASELGPESFTLPLVWDGEDCPGNPCKESMDCAACMAESDCLMVDGICKNADAPSVAAKLKEALESDAKADAIYATMVWDAESC